MYLTRRENGFRFQRRIPKNLEPILGKSPIRISLGNLPARDASHIARLLAGHSDLLFMELTMKGCLTLTDNSATTNEPDPRDEVIVLLGDYLVWYQDLLLETQEKAVKMADTHKEMRALAVTAAICEERKKYLSMITGLQSSYTNLRNQVNAAIGEATSEPHRQKFAQAQSELASLSEQFDEMRTLILNDIGCFLRRKNEIMLSLQYFELSL